MVLVNGVTGIGTGWSTEIPSYNPLDVIENVRRLMRGERLKTMVPWYRGFEGRISKDMQVKRTAYTGDFTGNIDVDEAASTLTVSGIPEGTWMTAFKAFVGNEDGKSFGKSKNYVAQVDELHTDGMAKYVLTLSGAAIKKVAKMTRIQLIKKFKLMDIMKSIHDENATAKFTGKFKTAGKIVLDEEAKEVCISELPVGTWTQTYKEFLEDKDGKVFGQDFTKELRENHTDLKVEFHLFLTDAAFDTIATLTPKELLKKFRLENSINTTNMVAFNTNGKLAKYKTAGDLLKEFFPVRRQYYEKRHKHLIEKLEEEMKLLANRARFVLMVVNGKLVITKKKKAVLMKELEKLKFDKIAPAKLKKKKGAIPTIDDGDDAGEDDEENYDYLFSMKLWSLTLEKVESLKRQRDEKEEELNAMRSREPEELWEEDLNELEHSIKELAALDDEEAFANLLQREKMKSKQRAKRKPAKKKAKKKTSSPKKRAGASAADSISLVPSSPARSEMTDVVSVISPESDVEIMSLAERLRARMIASQDTEASTLSSITMVDASPVAEISKKKRRLPKGKVSAKKTKAPKAKSRKRRVLDDDDDDEDFEFKDSDEEVTASPPKKARPARSRRGGTKPKYNFDDSDEDYEEEEDE